MKLFILLFLCFSISVAKQLTLYKFTQEQAQDFGSRCIDGSPSGFYYDFRGSGSGVDKLAIFLQGGGWCFIDSPDPNYYQDCKKRINGPLGSSNFFKSSVDPIFFMLSNDPQVNPDFYNWNFVLIPYCSGDLWLGTSNDSYLDTGLYSSGHNTVVATIEQLKAMNKWYSMNEVILAGGSAGGIGDSFLQYLNVGAGAHNNIDYFVSQNPRATWSLFVEAGWIIPHSTFGNVGLNTTQIMKVLLDRTTPYVNQRCKASMGDMWPACLYAPINFPYWGVRSFVAENLFDTNQLFAQYFVPDQSGILPPDACPFVRNFSSSMVQSLQQVINGSALHNGLFSPSCFIHGLETSELLQGINYEQLFGDWYFQRPNAKFPTYKALDPCHTSSNMLCNPSCKKDNNVNPAKCN